MAGFDNPEVAREAGKKSKRGPGRFSLNSKEKLDELLDTLHNDVMDNINELDTKEKAHFYAKVLDYRYPRRRSVDSRVDVSNLTSEEVDAMLDKIIKDGQ